MKNNANLAQTRIDRAIYATHPSMVERFILEPACGGGLLEDYLFEVESSDLFDRGLW